MRRETMYGVKGEQRELVWTLDHYIDELHESEQEFIDLIAMKVIKNSGYFFCKVGENIGSKEDSFCGENCGDYKPRNGKSGICAHNGPVYEDTEKEYRLYKNGKLERIK